MVELRRAAAADVESVVQVFAASFGTLTFLPLLHTVEEHRVFFAGVVAEQEVWLAEDDGRVLGFAALAGEMLSHLYVHPDAHGRGIGSALWAKAVERRPGGLSFWVFQENGNARRFYEARGARVVQLTDGSGNEERAPDALYRWAGRDATPQASEAS